MLFSAALSFSGYSQVTSTNNTMVAADVPAVHDVQDLGRRAGNAPVEVNLALRCNHETELNHLARAQQRPGSPQFHHWLAPAEFQARFSPTKEQEAYVIGALKEAGFTVTQTWSNRLLIKATAPASVVENFFQTEIHTVTQGSYGERYMNTKAALMPAHLTSVVRAAHISNVVTHQVCSHLVGQPLKSAKSSAIRTMDLGDPFPGYILPPVVGVDFDFPTQHGFDGTGHVAGVVIDSDVNENDIDGFWSFCGVNHTGLLFHEPVDGAIVGGLNAGGQFEATLDVETITSLAPGADCVMYIIPDLSETHICDAYNRVVVDQVVEVCNSSFTQLGDPADPMVESIAREGIVQGITWAASSGDWGANFGSPANETDFVSVGGTSVTDSNGHTGYETGWSGSGGGVSASIPLPSYQQGYAGLASYSGRNLPDIAFPAAYAAILFNGQWVGAYGTSWSCPQYVALQTLINHQLSQLCGRTNDAMYSTFLAYGEQIYFDVVDGNNGTYYCQAGYDNVTGLGIPYGYALGTWIGNYESWFGMPQPSSRPAGYPHGPRLGSRF